MTEKKDKEKNSGGGFRIHYNDSMADYPFVAGFLFLVMGFFTSMASFHIPLYIAAGFFLLATLLAIVEKIIDRKKYVVSGSKKQKEISGSGKRVKEGYSYDTEKYKNTPRPSDNQDSEKEQVYTKPRYYC